MLSEPRYQGPAMIIGWEGRIDGDNGDQFEQEMLSSALHRGQYVVIDGAQIEYVSSAGIRAFIIVARKLANAGQRMTICQLRPEVDRIFKTIGFDRLVPMHDTIEAAIAAA